MPGGIIEQLQTGNVLRNHHRRLNRLEATGDGKWYYIGDPDMPPFENGWDNIGGGRALASFYRSSQGVIRIRGAIGGGDYGAAAFTLPERYRPDTTQTFVGALTTDDGAATVRVDPDGSVTPIVPFAGGATIGGPGPIVPAQPYAYYKLSGSNVAVNGSGFNVISWNSTEHEDSAFSRTDDAIDIVQAGGYEITFNLVFFPFTEATEAAPCIVIAIVYDGSNVGRVSQIVDTDISTLDENIGLSCKCFKRVTSPPVTIRARSFAFAGDGFTGIDTEIKAYETNILLKRIGDA